MSDDLKHMKREELVEVVARAMREAWRDREDMRSETQEWENICGAEFIDCIASADAALTALCAALRIPPVALDAMAAGEAVVVPRTTYVAVLASLAASISLLERSDGRGAPSNKMFRMMLEDYRRDLAEGRAMLAASPYAAPDAEGGA